MFCIHCGKQIAEGSAFCTVCGKSQQRESAGASTSNLKTAHGYKGLLAANGLTKNVKHFEGLYTQIAVSEDGYLAIYNPYVPAFKGAILTSPYSAEGPKGSPEQPEKLDILYISQINDFDIEVYGNEKIYVSSGLGGALIGGKVNTTTAISGISLIIHTKDFNNPRIEVKLYLPFGPPTLDPMFGKSMNVPIYHIPYRLRLHCTKKMFGYALDKEGQALMNDVYNHGDINTAIAKIEELQSLLTQVFNAQQKNESDSNTSPQLSSADELVKFKSLLDSGVITQEEFDSKKKQLLGL